MVRCLSRCWRRVPVIHVSLQQFSPNRDGDRDATVITVTLSEAAQVQVRITDSQGKGVTYIRGFHAKQAGTYSYPFDGKVKDSSGGSVTLAEGTYFAEAATTGADGSVERRRTKFYINNTTITFENGSL